MSSFDGKVPIDIGSIKAHVVFDFEAIAKLEDEFGSDNIMGLVSSSSLVDTLNVLMIGLSSCNPEITIEDIKKARVPIYKIKLAIDDAFSFAYFGTNDPEKIAQLISGEDTAKSKKK